MMSCISRVVSRFGTNETRGLITPTPLPSVPTQMYEAHWFPAAPLVGELFGHCFSDVRTARWTLDHW